MRILTCPLRPDLANARACTLFKRCFPCQAEQNTARSTGYMLHGTTFAQALALMSLRAWSQDLSLLQSLPLTLVARVWPAVVGKLKRHVGTLHEYQVSSD